jgi:signal transduction histidine kinase
MASPDKRKNSQPEDKREPMTSDIMPSLSSEQVEAVVEQCRSSYLRVKSDADFSPEDQIEVLKRALHRLSQEYITFRHAMANRFGGLDFNLTFAYRIAKESDLRDSVVRTQLLEFLDNAVISATGCRDMLTSAMKPHNSESEIPKAKAKPINIGEYIERSFLRLAETMQISCKVFSNLTDKIIIADEQSLDIVVEELLKNAQKYASSSLSGKPLEISVFASAERKSVVIQIEDNGPGFGTDDPNEIENLFRDGVRGKNTTGIPGNGIGLAQCRRLCSYFKGTLIAMNKTNGSGALFVLSFPLANSR